jgi:cell wall-associated NlpC family hydrolase
MTDETLVKQARSWVGTPFKYQGRLKQVGCDCLGLIVGIARELNLKARTGNPLHEYDIRDYSSDPNTRVLQENLASLLWTSPCPVVGALVLMSFAGNPQHLGILCEHEICGFGLIHADITKHQVIEHGLTSEYAASIQAIYCFTEGY